MPLYLYRCGSCGAESEHLAKYEDREAEHPCLVCGEAARYTISAHHTQPDGIYSHTPNLGDAWKFEKQYEEARQRGKTWTV